MILKTVKTILLLSTLKKSSSLSMPLPKNQIIKPGLSANTLKTLLKQCTKHIIEESSLDLSGITWLEHINLIIGNTKQAEWFYEDILGCTRDLDAKFHFNLGQQQFHLAEDVVENVQRVYGSVGLVVPDLKNVRGRMKGDVDVLEDKCEEEGYMSVRCPWGNIFHLYCAKFEDAALLEDSSIAKKMVRLHASGGLYSSDRFSVRGKPGIKFIEILCPKDTTTSIQHFYESVIGCSTHSISTIDDTNKQRHVVSVSVGPGVNLLFVEENEENPAERALMEGVHICIYVPNFKALYDKLSDLNLIWTNPRFVHLDTCDTWEEARDSRTLRFKYVIDLLNPLVDGNRGYSKILELEHEVRPLRHGQYMKVPYYAPN